ncbi:MAG: hypothetical protein MJE68_25285 [Proteobacteria bacterium]|nr:hypothetical protein [Pseudomonadota bacterium]
MLAIYYAPHTANAFDRVIHIQRDVPGG